MKKEKMRLQMIYKLKWKISFHSTFPLPHQGQNNGGVK